MPGNTPTPVGLFPVSYTIGNGLPGAPLLALNLLVDAVQGTVRGNATVTQAINPPLPVHSLVWGSYTYLTLMPPTDSNILLTLQGSPGGPLSGLAENLQLHALLVNNWQTGVASYRYSSGGTWHDIENVPVRLREAPPTAIAAESYTNPVIIPMYAAALQGARASGNLAQMKNLAAEAQQRLDNEPQIRDALTILQGHIAELERS